VLSEHNITLCSGGNFNYFSKYELDPTTGKTLSSGQRLSATKMRCYRGQQRIGDVFTQQTLTIDGPAQ
jgi:hypothetical protein